MDHQQATLQKQIDHNSVFNIKSSKQSSIGMYVNVGVPQSLFKFAKSPKNKKQVNSTHFPTKLNEISKSNLRQQDLCLHDSWYC